MDQRRAAPAAALAALLFLVAGCQSYPLGMSEEEWRRLTPEQQMQARLRQAELDEANARRRAAEQAARRQALALAAARERRRIAALYRSGEFGAVLECVLDEGLADFHPGWRPYGPVAFTLVRGESKYLALTSQGGRSGRFWTKLSPDGLEISICHRQPAGGAADRRCATVAASSTGYARGIARTITVEDGFKNGRLQCAYRPVPGQQTVVINQRYVEIHRHIQHFHRPGVPHVRHVVVREHRPRGDARRGHWPDHPGGPPGHAGPPHVNPPPMDREIEDAVSAAPAPDRQAAPPDPERTARRADIPDGGERRVPGPPPHVRAVGLRDRSPGAQADHGAKANKRPPGPPPHARAVGHRDPSPGHGAKSAEGESRNRQPAPPPQAQGDEKSAARPESKKHDDHPGARGHR